MNRVRTAFVFPQPRADFAVILGLFVLEAEVFELRFDVVKAQTVRQRRIHEQRLRRDFLLLVWTHVLEGAHVVQAVRELDQNHPHVVAQREQHFSEVLGLGTGAGLEHPAHFGQAIDNRTLLGPKQTFHIVQGHVGVLHRVVKQRADDARRAQPHLLGHHTRHGNGMVDVGLPAFASNVLVRVQRDIEGLANGLALRALLGIFRRPQQPLGTSEESPAFPLPNRIPSPRKFVILCPICTSGECTDEPSVVHYFRTMTDATMTSWIEVPEWARFSARQFAVWGVFDGRPRCPSWDAVGRPRHRPQRPPCRRPPRRPRPLRRRLVRARPEPSS